MGIEIQSSTTRTKVLEPDEILTSEEAELLETSRENARMRNEYIMKHGKAPKLLWGKLSVLIAPKKDMALNKFIDYRDVEFSPAESS